MTLALTGGTVVTSLSPPRVVAGDVSVDQHRVVAVGHAPSEGARRDCSGCLIVPGNVCAHTHLYSSLARGMPYSLAPPVNFLQILQRVWWRLDRALDEGSIRASALAGAADALLAGTTTVIDHHASPNAIDGSLDVIADALEEVGVRSVLSYEVTDRDGPQRTRAGLAENGRFLETKRDLARGMVGAHASFTLSAQTLEACVGVARDHQTGIHIHLAEDDVDQRDALMRFGKRAAHRLEDAGALTAIDVAAHAVHLEPAEVATVKYRGVAVVHNPRSNMNNSVGRAPLGLIGERGALGTDGIGGDMFAESQAGYLRIREDEVRTPPQWSLDRLAEGARFTGRLFDEPALGLIEPGAPADLVVLDYAAPAPLTDAGLAGHWTFGLSAGRVRDVMVNGELVVADGQLTRLEQIGIAAQAREAADRLWRRVEETEPHPFEPEGGS